MVRLDITVVMLTIFVLNHVNQYSLVNRRKQKYTSFRQRKRNLAHET